MARVLAFPVELTGSGQFRMVDQHSDEDVLGAMHMALLCPHGHRPVAPDYGQPSTEFAPASVDRAAVIRDQLLADEPRLVNVLASQQVTLDTLIATVQVQGVR